MIRESSSCLCYSARRPRETMSRELNGQQHGVLMISPELPTLPQSTAPSRSPSRSILRTRSAVPAARFRPESLRKQVTFTDFARRGPLFTVIEVDKVEYPPTPPKGSCCTLL